MSKKIEKMEIETRGPVTQRCEERRQALLRTAAELFIERGFNDVSINEIVRKAGGSLATVYQWFGGKEELFFAAFKENMKTSSRFIEEFPVTGKGAIKDVIFLLEKIYCLQPYRMLRPVLFEGVNILSIRGDILKTFETKIIVPFTQWLEKLRQYYNVRFIIPPYEIVLIMIRILRGSMLELLLDPENTQKRQKTMLELTEKVLVLLIIQDNDSDRKNRSKNRNSNETPK